MAVMSLVGRAKIGSDAVLACTVSNGGAAHITFFQKCSENLQIGVEADTNFKMGESTASLGYQFDLPKVLLLQAYSFLYLIKSRNNRPFFWAEQ